jgi:hypothetical protein
MLYTIQCFYFNAIVHQSIFEWIHTTLSIIKDNERATWHIPHTKINIFGFQNLFNIIRSILNFEIQIDLKCDDIVSNLSHPLWKLVCLSSEDLILALIVHLPFKTTWFVHVCKFFFYENGATETNAYYIV